MNTTTSFNKHVQELMNNGSHFFINNPLTGFCVTENGYIVFCNARFAEILGFSDEELLGTSIWRLFHQAEQRDTSWHELNEIEIEELPTTLNMVGMAKNGSVVHTRQCIYEYEHKGKQVTAWHVMDVTQNRATQANLEESEQRLRNLSNQILQIQERERKRVALELHDGIGQTLSLIKFGLENEFRKHHENLPEEILEKLMSAVSGIQSAVEEVRRISMNLHPSVLDDLGIEAAVTSLCREFRSFMPSIDLTHVIDVQRNQIDSELSVVIFRILQETLNNISKHAQATQVYVSLTSGKRGVTMSVRDNGCGFHVDRVGANHRLGFGIHSMKERAKLSGGHLRIDSVPGAGTGLEVSWERKVMIAHQDNVRDASENRGSKLAPGDMHFRHSLGATESAGSSVT